MSSLLDQRGATLRKVAEQLGVSRSFVQRRSVQLFRQIAVRTCTPEREDAGVGPLRPGHPISWDAIRVPCQEIAPVQ